MATSAAIEKRLADSGDSCHLSLRVDGMLPNWNRDFKLLDDLAATLKGSMTVACTHAHKQGSFAGLYKSDPVVDHHRPEAVSRLRLLRDYTELAFSHWSKSLIFDALYHVVTLNCAHHAKKVDNRTLRLRKIQICSLYWFVAQFNITKLHC